MFTVVIITYRGKIVDEELPMWRVLFLFMLYIHLSRY